jgi:hypothetical protein
MKYRFNFNEINYGSIVVESDHTPTESELINAVLEGKADYHETDFTDFRLVEQERQTPRKERTHER